MIKAVIISGELGKILARQKSGTNLEIGELLIVDSTNTNCQNITNTSQNITNTSQNITNTSQNITNTSQEINNISQDINYTSQNGKILLEVNDLLFGSQISQQNLELMSGIKLEHTIDNDLDILEKDLRTYNIAVLKPILFVKNNKASLCKNLPEFFSEARELEKDDLNFLFKPQDSLFMGNLRSGSRVVDVPIYLPGEDVLSHHVLIAGTTGKGKSVLMSNLLWSCVNQNYCGLLVLDPHDEYYGRNKLGLKDHINKDKVVYYTYNDVPVGSKTLKINLKNIKPSHFNGAVNFSDAQKQAISAYYKKYGVEWVESVVLDKPLDVAFHEATLAVVKRRILSLLDLEFANSQLFCNSVFDLSSGENTVTEICNELEQGKVVVIDTSLFSGAIEILIGSLITSEIFRRYKKYKIKGELTTKPVISVVLEEAPRVLGKEVLEQGSNIFSTIAREGRKFKIGLTAITQLPSLIPRQILANMNTKIILGIEMAAERQAIIESASQDLSSAGRAIASLDKGEAIVTSNFSKFAIPLKIPLFSERVKKEKELNVETENVQLNYGGIDF